MNAAVKQIHIHYFALMREERGLANETITTAAKNVGELFSELNAKYRFSLPTKRLNVAINEDFASWDSELKEHDKVVFIPPVAGG
jgi:molybdopterin converting factor small subunit